MRFRTHHITRDGQGRLMVLRDGDRIGWLHPDMTVLDFVERWNPQQRPGAELVIDLDDIGYRRPAEEVKLMTVTDLRKALRHPMVKRVEVKTRALGSTFMERRPISSIKKMLKGRSGNEMISGVSLYGGCITMMED